MKSMEKEIIDLIKKMERNTFLLPNGWSEKIYITKKQECYKTYVGARGINRYISITYTFEDNKEIEVKISGETITIEGLKLFDITDLKELKNKIGYIIKTVYEEKHSFIDNAEGIKSIRKKIRECQSNIKEEQNKILELNDELKDLKLLSKGG